MHDHRSFRLHALAVPALLALSSLLAACKPAPTSAENAAAAPQPAAATPATAPPAGTSATAPASDCPITDFEAFAQRFGREISFQELTTADPLTMERYDAQAQPEPRRVTEQVALDDVTWPVMPDLTGLETSGRRHEIAPIADGGMRIRIHTPDTSDQQTYEFRQAPCWQLQRVVDESI